MPTNIYIWTGWENVFCSLAWRQSYERRSSLL